MKYAQLKEWIEASPRTVFFGGAGVSTESGIPDFRSENGIFRALEKYGRSPETLLSRTYFDLRPDGIIRMLDLRKPIYSQTAAYGHFGRPDLDLPWERLDRVDSLRARLGL